MAVAAAVWVGSCGSGVADSCGTTESTDGAGGGIVNSYSCIGRFHRDSICCIYER